jgi:hypothetical protein
MKMRKKKQNTLTDKDIVVLYKLAADITANLDCGMFNTKDGRLLPCRTCRLQAVKDMIHYVEIHGYTVTK